MKSENNKNLPGQPNQRAGQHRAEVTHRHNPLGNQRRTKGCQRPNQQEACRNAHHKRKHRHKEKFYQIRNKFIKEFFTFGSKINYKNNRNHRACVIHGYHGNAEKISIYGGFEHRSGKQCIQHLPSCRKRAGLYGGITHNRADYQPYHRFQPEFFRGSIPKKQRQEMEQAVTNSI